MLVFTSAVAVLSGLRKVPEAFAGGDEFVISDSSAPTIFSSRVQLGLVDALRSAPNITGASPETFAFSHWNGVSFVVRGYGGGFGDVKLVSPEQVVYALPFDQIRGDAPDAALVGERLLARLGLVLPYTLPLVGSYSSKLELVKVCGSFKTDTPLDDELLVSNEVARRLSGLRADEVSIIRVSTTAPEWLSELLSPRSARFALFDLHVSSALASPGDAVGVSVCVRNWGGAEGSVAVTIEANGSEPMTELVTLGAHSSCTVRKQVSFESMGRQLVRASISGDFPVVLFANVTVVDPFLTVSAPSRVLLGSAFNATVTDHLGEPVQGCAVVFGQQSAFSDPQGRVVLNASEQGTFNIKASLPGYLDGRATVAVLDPSAFPSEFNASVTSFALSPDTIDESGSAHGVAVVENTGLSPGTYRLIVYLDSKAHLAMEVPLQGLSSKTVVFDLEDLSPGTHFVQVGAFSRELVVEPWFSDNPGLVQLVVRYGGATSLSPSGTVPIYQAAKLSEANVSVALSSIGAISALMAALAITGVFSKEVHEGRKKLGILRTIGASRADVRRLVLPQALENAFAGAALGVGLGVAVADLLSRSGAFVLFGHQMALEPDTGLIVLVLLGAVAIGVSSALVSSMVAVRETAISSIKRLEPLPGPGPDAEELLEDQRVPSTTPIQRWRFP